MNDLRTFIKEVILEQNAQKQHDIILSAGEIKTMGSPKVLVHRTNDPNVTIDTLDPLAVRQTRQSKRGSEPKVGLYTYEDINDVPRYGDNRIEIRMPAGTRYIDITGLGRGASSRISLETAAQLLSSGIDLITGYDYIGPQEWIILRMPRKLTRMDKI